LVILFFDNLTNVKKLFYMYKNNSKYGLILVVSKINFSQ
jgi:hypothetical protein